MSDEFKLQSKLIRILLFQTAVQNHSNKKEAMFELTKKLLSILSKYEQQKCFSKSALWIIVL